MALIFLSYRRDDSADAAGRIRDRLDERFGASEIFTDVDSIPYGVDFRDYIDRKVAQCEVFMAIIGPQWLAPEEDGQRRIDRPDDFVRLEIEFALKRDIPVVPLLVRQASMPAEHQLPEGIRELAYRNGTPIRPDPDFHPDMERLLQGLGERLPEARRPPAADEATGTEAGGKRQRRSKRRWLLAVGLIAAALSVAILRPWESGDRAGPVDPGAGKMETPPVEADPPAIDQIRAQVTIRAGRDPDVVDYYQGKPRRHYSVWIEAPAKLTRRIAEVEYRYPKNLVSPDIMRVANRADGFRTGYLGIGAVYDMDVIVILVDGTRIEYDFNMHRAIFGD